MRTFENGNFPSPYRLSSAAKRSCSISFSQKGVTDSSNLLAAIICGASFCKKGHEYRDYANSAEIELKYIVASTF